MIEYKDMHWEGNHLYYGNKNTTVTLVQDTQYDFMYWLEWDFNGAQKSVNFYNIYNARDNARVLYMRYCNDAAEKRHREARTCV